jgi:hypothetical protein
VQTVTLISVKYIWGTVWGYCEIEKGGLQAKKVGNHCENNLKQLERKFGSKHSDCPLTSWITGRSHECNVAATMKIGHYCWSIFRFRQCTQ